MDKRKKNLWKRRAKELFEKEIITEEQSITLNGMIDSQDGENFTIVHELVKTMIREKLSENLNKGQLNAFNTIIDFVENHEKSGSDDVFNLDAPSVKPMQTTHALVLKGYAGTGKTFLVKRIIEYIIQVHDNKRIAIAAPTNKAVKVLYNNSVAGNSKEAFVFDDIFDGEGRLLYTTTHKLLGLKEVISDTGDQNFVVDKHNNCKLNDFDCLIVDEVSMLDDKICNDIMKFSHKLPIIFLGDPAQIPPVKREDSIPFSGTTKYSFDKVELTEIMRQKGEHPIIDSSFIIRDNLKSRQPIPLLQTKLNTAGHGIIHIDSIKDMDKVRPLLKQYFDTNEFREDSDYMKVIGWRNRTIDYINSIVRELLYGKDLPKFVVGEKLVVSKPIFEEDDDMGKYAKWRIVHHTSDEFEVTAVNIITKSFNESGNRLSMKMYKLSVLSTGPDGNMRSTIHTVHEDSEVPYQKFLNMLKGDALRARDAKLWIKYFNALKWSANITYNYAVSAHKSQGSTYKNILVLENDIDANMKVVERNRIKYTAYTRATDVAYILK